MEAVVNEKPVKSTECIIDKCSDRSRCRGLCYRHFKRAYRLVNGGHTTWEEMIASGTARAALFTVKRNHHSKKVVSILKRTRTVGPVVPVADPPPQPLASSSIAAVKARIIMLQMEIDQLQDIVAQAERLDERLSKLGFAGAPEISAPAVTKLPATHQRNGNRPAGELTWADHIANAMSIGEVLSPDQIRKRLGMKFVRRHKNYSSAVAGVYNACDRDRKKRFERLGRSRIKRIG